MKLDCRVLSSRTLAITDYVTVKEDVVQFGRSGSRKMTVLRYHHNAYATVALKDDGNMLLVRVARYPIDDYLWDLPGGKMREDDPSPLDCAQRELEEESGYRAHTMEELLPEHFPEPSHSTERLGLFLAKGLEYTGKQQEDSGRVPDVDFFAVDQAVEMVFSGQIRSSWSIAGILAFALKQRLGLIGP